MRDLYFVTPLLADCALLILKNGPGPGSQLRMSCVPLVAGSQVHDLDLGLNIIKREKCKHVFSEETIQSERKKSKILCNICNYFNSDSIIQEMFCYFFKL